jgi:hypothetical protein
MTPKIEVAPDGGGIVKQSYADEEPPYFVKDGVLVFEVTVPVLTLTVTPLIVPPG